MAKLDPTGNNFRVLTGGNVGTPAVNANLVTGQTGPTGFQTNNLLAHTGQQWSSVLPALAMPEPGGVGSGYTGPQPSSTPMYPLVSAQTPPTLGSPIGVGEPPTQVSYPLVGHTPGSGHIHIDAPPTSLGHTYPLV